ncbi:hypothetical protein HO173_010086 [Letharia columbiana]|uniref:Mis12 domain-containing protein n=1 Tax=Letharia columbiana TaxID=112416 RepID=A0A8H6FNI6_9LECA|nr:uncharacterized protein HO173_010086 [Letharia columbiana]KAF6231784.1 hypothetical protein HO173_010086 [Letharia columbiana]
MTDPNRQADALLTEHFQYTPLSLIDDIINAVNTIIYQAIEALENGLLSIPPKQLGFARHQSPSTISIPDTDGDGNVEYPEATTELENGVHQLETLLESTVDKSFDKFEIYTLRNILTIPDDLSPWMRLAHYEDIQLPISSSAPTPESILLLRRKLQETRKLNLALRSTHARNATLISQLNTLLSPPTAADGPSLAFLTSHTNPAAQSLNLSFSPSSKDTTPLTTNAQFATSQLPALKKLVAELRPKMQEVREGPGGKVDWDGEREKRRAYIESGVRRHVGVGRENGEAVGGEIRARDEVEGLEAVVGALGQGSRMEE